MLALLKRKGKILCGGGGGGAASADKGVQIKSIVLWGRGGGTRLDNSPNLSYFLASSFNDNIITTLMVDEEEE